MSKNFNLEDFEFAGKKASDQQGFPIPSSSSVPAPFQAMEPQYHPYAEIEIDEYKNTPFGTISNQVALKLFRKPANCTGRIVLIDKNQNRICGTATLISKDEALVAKHCIQGLNYSDIWLMMESEDIKYFQVSLRSDDPQNLDMSILRLKGNPGLIYGFVDHQIDDQPIGRHFMIHYAGGKVKQVSTGNFATSPNYLIEQNLFADAGPLASGAGVFNSAGKLIGISIYRTPIFHKLSRIIILLAHSNLFIKNPFCLASENSVVKFLDRQTSPSPFPTFTQGNMSSNPYDLLGISLYHSTHPVDWLMLSLKGFQPSIQTPNAFGGRQNFFLMDLDRDAYEGIRMNHEIKKGKYNIEPLSIVVNDFDEINNFLMELEKSIKKSKSMDSSKIPPSLKLKKNIFETHQEQHVKKGARKGKTIFLECIAVSAKSSILKALGICIKKIAKEYQKRYKIPNGKNYSIDLGFTIAEKNGEKFSNIMIQSTSMVKEEFHIFPCDSEVLKASSVKIDCLKSLFPCSESA